MNLTKNRVLLSLLAALLCACLLFVACNDGQEEETKRGEQTSAPAQQAGTDRESGSQDGTGDSQAADTQPESGADAATDSETEAQTSAQTQGQTGAETEGRTDSQTGGQTPEDGTETEPNAETVSYTVSVIGSDGKARQGALVSFVKGEEQVGSMPTAADGTVTMDLAPDTYDVVIGNILGEKYNTEGCVVTPESPSLTVRLGGVPTPGEEIYAYSEALGDYKEYNALRISEGNYFINVDAQDMTYYLFVASRGGTFRLSADESLPISIGYYGSTSFVLTESVVTEQDNAICVDVFDDMAFQYAFVIGVRAEDASVGECMLSVEYLSERETTENDVPWTDLMPADELEKYTLGAGTITDFAVDSAEIGLVYSEADGYYHVGSEDGPVVLVNLGNDSKYMDALTTVCSSMRLGVYVYDENGKLVSKDSYNEMIWAYNEKADGGYYPLDDTLMNMLKVVGDYMGWYDPASPMYLFEGVALEPANAYLFACVYLK